MSRFRRLAGVTLGALLLAGTPAFAQQAAPVPTVSVSGTSDLDPAAAGQKVTIKGTGFDPKINEGKGYGVRIGPQRAGWRDKATTTWTQYSKLLKENWQFGIALEPDGSWQAEPVVKANYTAGGEQIGAAGEQMYVMIFLWDSPDTTRDIVIPLNFKGLSAPPKAVEGALNWGIKASWRAYIGRGGTVTPSQGATVDTAGTAPYPYVWPLKKTAYDPKSGKGEIQFSGKVNYAYEAHTIWDYGLADPKIVINADGTGTLKAVVNFAFYGTKAAPEKVFGRAEVTYADLAFDGKPVVSGRGVTLKIKSATLTEQGASAFAGFYGKGEALDAGTLGFTADVPPATCELGPEVGKGNLLWGFKRSFRSYMGNGKGNSITASSGAEITETDVVANPNGIATGAYRFPFGSAEYTSATRFGVSFAGEIKFDYPTHLFTVHLGNPRVVVDGKAGSLYADVELKAQPGAPGTPAKLTGVELAKLNLDAATVTESGGALTVTGIAATLASSEAFAGFYSAGDKLDDLTVTLGATCSTLPPPPTPGQNPPPPPGEEDLVPPLAFRPQLANTGAGLTGVWIGGLLLLSGAVAVYFGRRVRRS